MSSLPRERLGQLIAALLSKQGPRMVADVERRVEAGECLEVKGIKVDASVLLDALEQHSRSALSAKQNEGVTPGVGSQAVSPPATNVSIPDASEASAEPKPSARWTPGGDAGGRWKPGAASASLLTSKALTECEQAEPFSRTLGVAGDQQVTIFQLPDILGKSTGEKLSPSQSVEVVARYLSQRDGRVYLRLKADHGWVCTRSSQDLSVLVLESTSGPPLEPEKFRSWPLKSVAMDVLPVLETAEPSSSTAADEDPEDEEMPMSCESDDEEEPEDNEKLEGTADESGEEGGDAVEDDQDDVEEDAEEQIGSPSVRTEREIGSPSLPPTSPAPTPSPAKKRQVRKFKVLGRCAILSKPDFANLMSNGIKTLQKGETFLADGALFLPGEQRAYLRLTRGLGWISERSKQDIWRMNIAKCSTRKVPISKKMARAVAFRGGDAGGKTHLKKDDLVKNSQGKIVSKKASEAAKKRVNESLGKWTEAVKRARTDLGVAGFEAVKKGSALYEKAQEHYKQLKAGRS